MAEEKYRCTVRYDASREAFVAQAPELEHCHAEGETRAEALTRLEEEIAAQISNMREGGGRPPVPVDEETFTGEIVVKVSQGLHRELVYRARAEGTELDPLVGELLAGALESRRQGRVAPRRPGPAEREAEAGGRGGHRDRGRQGQGSRYHGIMDDRANFIEYVRGLDQGGGGPSGGRWRRRRPRGGGQGGGSGGGQGGGSGGGQGGGSGGGQGGGSGGGEQG